MKRGKRNYEELLGKRKNEKEEEGRMRKSGKIGRD